MSHKGGPIIVNDLRSCINATIMGLVVKTLLYCECELYQFEFMTPNTANNISYLNGDVLSTIVPY